MSSQLYRHSGVVACGHPLPAQAAENLLREGGNAYDALAAAFFVSCFAEPMLASLAGGGFFMLQPESERPRVLDCFANTPRTKIPRNRADIECVKLDFGATTQTFQIGWGTVAVPGMLRGVCSMHRQLGRVDIKEIIRSAIDTGRQPIVINDTQATIFETLTPVCVSRESAARLYASAGDSNRVVAAGDSIDFTQLADTLDVLAVEGEDLFYRGEIAAMFDATAAHGGGILTRSDLERYEVVVREPLSVDLGTSRVALTPAPSAGGMLVAFGLTLAQACDWLNADAVPVDRALHLIDIMRATSVARVEATDSDGYDWPDAEKLLNPIWLEQWTAELRQRRRAWRGTTHMSVIDASGNLASLTTSNGAGCGEIVGQTGIMPNNMLGEDDLNPRGLYQWDADTRLSSMMTPTIIYNADGTRTTLGSGGSNRIRTAMLQVITNLALLDWSLDDAVSAPRIHIEEDALFIEGGFTEDVLNEVIEHYPEAQVFHDLSFYFGGVHVATQGPSGAAACGDPRRGGCARIVAL